MRLSFKQALAMLDVLKASLNNPGVVGGYPYHIRKMLINQIINQQSQELFDLLPGDELEWNWEELKDGDDNGSEGRMEHKEFWTDNS